jgi:hypothetical protein
MYENILMTISTIAELLILYFVWKEGRKVVATVNDIKEARNGTVYGATEDLPVGTKVVVLQPRPGEPREKWQYGTEVYAIRESDSATNRALATPVLPPIQGPTPTVSGPMSGPLSPFRKISAAG